MGVAIGHELDGWKLSRKGLVRCVCGVAMRGINWRLALLISILFFSVSSTSSSAYSTQRGELIGGTVSTTGGNSVIVEVHTATWCEYCAETDDILPVLRTEHERRLSLISLHPIDGTDLLPSMASTHRLDRLHMNAGKLTGTPTIFMEGEISDEGLFTAGQITSSLFNSESNLRARTEIGISAHQSDDILSVSVSALINDKVTFNHTQISVMIANDEPELLPGDPVEGSGPYYSTLNSLIEVEIVNSSSEISYDAFPPQNWAITDYVKNNSHVSFVAHLIQPLSHANTTSIVVSHEIIEEEITNYSTDVLGVASIVQSDINQEKTSSAWIIAACLFMGFVIIADSKFRRLWPPRKDLLEEE